MKKSTHHKHRKVFLNYLIASSIVFLLAVSIVYAYGSNVNEEKESQISLQWVSHTEYWRDDKASTIVRLADYQGVPITAQWCNVNILYPDKTVFVDNQPLSNSGINGNWYRTDSLEGAPLGTYEQEVTCLVGKKTVKSSQSFHLNPALEEISVLKEMGDARDTYLSNMDVEIRARINGSRDEVVSEIHLANTSISTLIGDVRDELKSNTDNAQADINSNLENVRVSINGRITSTGDSIRAEIREANASIMSAITEANTKLESDINERLDEIKTNVDSIKADTTWIAGHAMNDEDMSEISSRFNAIDANLSVLMQGCDTGEAVPVTYCAELGEIETKLDTMKAEQDEMLGTLNTINETTYNTFQLLSGDIATKIDAILLDLGIIKAQTNEINETTHQILDEMQSQVQIQVIS